MFASWACADIILHTVLIVFGQGPNVLVDELEIFSVQTPYERMLAFSSYLLFFTVFLQSCCELAGELFTKYQSFFGLHLLVAAQLRLPAFAAISQPAWTLLHGYVVFTFISHVMWVHKAFQPNVSGFPLVFLLLGHSPCFDYL